jgi:hypothetical protein
LTLLFLFKQITVMAKRRTATKKTSRPKTTRKIVRRSAKKLSFNKKPASKKIKGSLKSKKKKVIRYRSPLAKKPPRTPKKPRFKTVRHPKDGLGIQFRIPTSWKQTWGSEDNSLFYPPVPEHKGPSPLGGKLFVRFRLETVANANDGAAFGLLMVHRTDSSQMVTQLNSGAFMLHFQSRHNTEGFNAIDYYWILAMPLPPRRVAVASFLFSGVAELFDGAKAPGATIVAMLEREIPVAKFDKEALPVQRDEHLPTA